MMPTSMTADVGVVIGRFQVPTLHVGHAELLSAVSQQHKKVIVLLGVSPVKTSCANPLDYQMRVQALRATFPEIVTAPVFDTASDELWSKEVDATIANLVGPGKSVVIYGARDSFIKHYSGRYRTVELQPEQFNSGTEVRQAIGNGVVDSPEFRAGVVWATQNQFRKVYPTVDVAILNHSDKQVLLARKKDDTPGLWRFIGGFADPDSESYEADASREAREETGLEVDTVTYIGSFVIDDWRYRAEPDKIKTLFFVSRYVFGAPEARDDVDEVKWHHFASITEAHIMPQHRCLFAALKGYLNNK